MFTFALSEPKTYIWIDVLYNSSANELITIIRNMETRHGIVSLIRTKYGGLTLYNFMRAVVVRYRFIQSYIRKLLLRGN